MPPGRPKKLVQTWEPGDDDGSVPSLEEMLTGEDWFGLTTATPCQRAICRIAEGRPLVKLLADEAVQAMLWRDGYTVQDRREEGGPPEMVHPDEVLAAVEERQTRREKQGSVETGKLPLAVVNWQKAVEDAWMEQVGWDRLVADAWRKAGGEGAPLMGERGVPLAPGGTPLLTRFGEPFGARPKLLAPKEYGNFSAPRTAKSLLAAAIIVRAARSCDLEGLKPGDVPRASVVAPKMDLAGAVFTHAKNTMLEKPKLRAWLLEEPTSDRIRMKNASGREVEVMVVAGAKAGSSLVARWSIGVVFDEAPRMNGEDDGVVNLPEARRAILVRMRPGAQIAYIGSPLGPEGPVYDMVQKHWGKPSKQIVVVRPRGPDMNPELFTPEFCEEILATDPIAYRTEVLGEFADQEATLFPSDVIDACTRAPAADGSPDLPPDPRCQYVAKMDPAQRGNSWTLAVATKNEGRRRVALVRQWTGSTLETVEARAVFREMAAILAPYQVSVVETDQWAFDALRELAEMAGLVLVLSASTAKTNVAMYSSLATRMRDGMVELPPVLQVKVDLRAVKRRIRRDAIQIVLPVQQGGRHCDYAPSIVGVLARPVEDEEAPVDTSPGALMAKEEARVKAAHVGDGGGMQYWEPRWQEDAVDIEWT